MVIQSRTFSWRGLIHSSQLPVCVRCYPTWQTWTEPDLLFLSSFVSLLHFSLSLSSEWTAIIFLWHIVWILWISSTKPIVSVCWCVLKAIFANAFVWFFIIQFWYRVSSGSVNLALHLDLIWSHQVNSLTWFYPEEVDLKHKKSKRHRMGSVVTPKSLGNVKHPKSSVMWGVALHAETYFNFLTWIYKKNSSSAAIVTTWKYSGAARLVCHFANCSHEILH